LEMVNLKFIIHSTALSKSEKKKRIKAMYERLGKDFFWTGGLDNPESAHRDKARIREVRKALKFKHGNCRQKSAIASTWLLENTPGDKHILWVAANPAYDHAWTVYGYEGAYLDPDINNWNADAVIVDGWTSDWYQAKHPYDFTEGNHFPNP